MALDSSRVIMVKVTGVVKVSAVTMSLSILAGCRSVGPRSVVGFGITYSLAM